MQIIIEHLLLQMYDSSQRNISSVTMILGKINFFMISREKKYE